ncbi:serine hydrolase domain-containing protein [Wohlfahrtiimonas populi]|uniref:serine hydrolase domain-containing protein n=1 Tax=Wohlfahrtiimonas populi TaxID=1940240 RepID=UPI00098D2F12|nr:serine hydrolase [Wohlfahrtiimonas populi]
MQQSSQKLKRAFLALSVSLALITTSAFAHDVVNPHKDEPIGTVRQVYDGALTPDLQVNTFRNIDRLFATAKVAHDPSNIKILPHAKEKLGNVKFKSHGKDYDLYDYLSINRISGLIIIKDGEIVLEDYELGNNENTRWMSMSVVKSITATLIGMAIQDGYIKSIDDPIVNYLPELKGSSYDGVTVKHILQMASGVAWNETYTDPTSDRRKLLEIQLEQKPGEALKLMASLPRAGEPGTVWNYSTGETQVAGALVKAAVGKPVSEYLSEKIWTKAGMESDATWWLESPEGLEVGGSGLSATLRDYARFGLLLLNEGIIDGKESLPKGWMKEAGAQQMIGGKKVNYGYMLWPVVNSDYATNESAYEAVGIFGQHVYVNPKENLVIAVWGAQPKPTTVIPIEDTDFFGAVADKLKK